MRRFLFLSAIFFAALATNIWSETSGNGEAILRQAWENYRAPNYIYGDEWEQVVITLPNGKVKKMNRYSRLKSNGEDMVMAEFTYPPLDRRKLLILRSARVEMYLNDPSLGKTRRVADVDNGTFFIGSIAYEDAHSFFNERFPEHFYEVIAQNNVQYIVRATPRKPESSSYGARDITVGREDSAILGVVFYDRSNQIIKTLTNRRIADARGGWRAMSATITTAGGEETVVETVSRQFGKYDVFSNSALERR